MKKLSESAPTTRSEFVSENNRFLNFRRLVDTRDETLLAFLQQQNFPHPSRLIRSSPKNTKAVSVTNHECRLQCSHCRGHYLKGMTQMREFKAENLEANSSILISGGSAQNGVVPIGENIQFIDNLPREMPLNIHTGFQSAEKLLALKGRPVTISFDMVGDEETIRETFGLHISVREIQAMYLDLARHFPVVPHITIGLNRGRISGEKKIIGFLKEHPSSTVTFLVFRPTPKTPFEKSNPPPIEDVVKIILFAATELQSGIKLGCMRPAGEYRRRLDPLAWLAGAETIVHPDRGLVKTLMDNGIPVEEKFECCSLEDQKSHAG